ncbi:MAG: anion permease [Candidatus Nanohaloarchaea archaeon]
MINALAAVAVLASIFMGVSIGSSGVASAFGPVNSSGSFNVFRSALFAGMFALLGALTQGGNVTQTVGSGLLVGDIQVLQGAITLLVAAALVIFSVLTDYPMPTAFTVIGAVIGGGMAFGNAIQWSSVHKIVGYWLLIPFISVLLGYSFARLLRRYVSKENSEKQIRYLLILTGSYVAYTAGASAVGLAVGPLSSLDVGQKTLLVIGGLSMLAGAWMYSPRIIRAISYDYSSLGPRRSVAALGTAGILAQVGILFGIPISFNEAVIASVIGSGVVSNRSTVDRKKIGFTAAAWTSAFFLSGAITFLAATLVQAI